MKQGEAFLHGASFVSARGLAALVGALASPLPVAAQEEDGDWAVNTTQSIFLNNGKVGGDLLPPQVAATVGDRLTAKGVDGAPYAGGWSLAIKANCSAEEEKQLADQPFQWHHQPFAYFSRFAKAFDFSR